VREEEGDCLKTSERKIKKGGVFTQYTLLVTDETGENKEVRYLTMKDLNELTKHHGSDSVNWVGHWVEVKRKVVERAGIEYENLEVRPSNQDADIEDVV
jgi:hypothetical protein